jgi:hypothetical protein
VKQPSLLIRKPKILRSNPFRKSLIISGNDLGFLINDEDIFVSYRRPQIVENNGDDLNEKIKWKLFLARQLALLAYNEKWG